MDELLMSDFQQTILELQSANARLKAENALLLCALEEAAVWADDDTENGQMYDTCERLAKIDGLVNDAIFSEPPIYWGPTDESESTDD